MPPVDHEAREQIRTRLDETLFVEAGAGTGKTTALVSRIVELVRHGAEMRRIAAITFTEAAAAQLRDRVRTALERAADAGEVDRAVVAEVDDAAISTLHAFAQRILLDHPLEAGLPPLIEVLDEIQSSLAFEERWREFLDQLLDDPAYETVLLRGFATQLRLDALREVAHALHDHRDRLKSGPDGPPSTGPIDRTALLDAIEAAASYAGACLADDDVLVWHLGRLDATRRRLAAAEDDLEFLHIVATSSRLACVNGQQPNWSCDVEVVRQACAAAEQARFNLLLTVRREILSHLVHAISRFTVASARERRTQGRLDFHDLLVEARDVLRARPDVCAAVRERFSHLLIDEFQDTDPLQVELAVLLAGRPHAIGPAGGPVAWQDYDIEPGRLFFVGDAKQSIYRFRRADIALFDEVQRFLVNSAIQLSANFRSVPGIVAWVNAVFEPLLGEGVEGEQAAYEPLLADRAVVLGAPAPPVVLVGGPDERKVADVRDTEAADIAGIVRRIVEQEGWLVGGEAGAPPRQAKYKDIAILLPTRTSLPHLESALDEEDLPYRVESASLVWGMQEVRDVLSVLRAVDDPTDEVALVAALRSPLLGCTDRELFQFRRAGGSWRLTAPLPDTLPHPHRVRDAMAVLADLHGDRWWAGAAGMVERVVRQRRAYELAFARPRQRDQWRRLRFLVDQARAFQEAGGRTLREFLAWAELQGADDARVREPVLPESDDDAVRILTVHGAKGLEFPIVVMSGLNRTGVRSSGPQVHFTGDTPEVRVGYFETSGFAAVAEVERRLASFEQDRLLYVAATRARDHLVVCLHHKKGTRCHAAVLFEQSQDETTTGLWRSLGEPLFRLASPPSGIRPPAEPDAPAARQRWHARREQSLAHWRRARVYAATAIAEAAKDEPDLDAPFYRRGRAGTSIGRAVHATLQSVDLATGEGVAGIAAAQATAEGVERAAAEVEALALAALRSDVVRAAVQGRFWRELYVAAPVADTTVEGFVDLVYEDGEGELVVVDYKTDAVRSDAEADASQQRYRLQVATYALALELVLGRPVRRAVLLFVSGGVAREREVDDLGSAKLEVRRMLDAAEVVPM